jgi:3-oxoacyl-[acyl-carrier protein] reductase
VHSAISVRSAVKKIEMRGKMRLPNKVCIITGASSGIGRESAILFAGEGSKIVVSDIDDAGGGETEALFLHADVSSGPEVGNMIRKTKEKFGRIDIILNSAGIIQKPVPVEDLDEVVWDRIFEVNVKGIFLMAKFAVPVMKEAGKGVIINVASISGVRPRLNRLAYASSKAAAIHLTKALALELARFNIRVNAINPVSVDTPMLAKLYPQSPEGAEGRKKLLSTIPLGRIAKPGDIAYAALYLASDESAMLTGACIDVDGGRGI